MASQCDEYQSYRGDAERDIEVLQLEKHELTVHLRDGEVNNDKISRELHRTKATLRDVSTRFNYEQTQVSELPET